MSSSIFYPGLALVQTQNVDYSEHSIYGDTVASAISQVYAERHELPETFIRQTCIKEFILEVPDTALSFRFEDEDIYRFLHCEVWNIHSDKEDGDGCYRVHKGYIEGTKTNGQWEIDFEVFYGGKHNDKYRMIKGANY